MALLAASFIGANALFARTHEALGTLICYTSPKANLRSVGPRTLALKIDISGLSTVSSAQRSSWEMKENGAVT